MASRKSTATAPVATIAVTPEVAALIEQLQAAQAQGGPVTTDTPTPAEPTEFDAKIFADSEGFALNRGRVTLNSACLKAAARVLKSGTPEIVEAGGNRNTHLVIFRGEHGVSLHNARKV